MKNKFIVIFSGVIFISFLAIYKGGGGVKKPISESAKNYKIKIVTSFYPLYFITSEIAKEKAAVVNLTPSGAEPHDFEPNTQNITNIYESRLLIINGSGFEPWVEKIEEDLRDKNVNILAVAKDLARSEIDEQGGMIKDPHVWLDPILAKQIVIIIKEAIKLIDPENKSFYEENGMKLESKMELILSDPTDAREFVLDLRLSLGDLPGHRWIDGDSDKGADHVSVRAVFNHWRAAWEAPRMTRSRSP